MYFLVGDPAPSAPRGARALVAPRHRWPPLTATKCPSAGHSGRAVRRSGRPDAVDGALECPGCGKLYRYLSSFNRHRKFECGKEPTFQCAICDYRGKRKARLDDHVKLVHAGVTLSHLAFERF